MIRGDDDSAGFSAWPPANPSGGPATGGAAGFTAPAALGSFAGFQPLGRMRCIYPLCGG
jgi:hypothetical protein